MPDLERAAHSKEASLQVATISRYLGYCSTQKAAYLALLHGLLVSLLSLVIRAVSCSGVLIYLHSKSHHDNQVVLQRSLPIRLRAARSSLNDQWSNGLKLSPFSSAWMKKSDQ